MLKIKQVAKKLNLSVARVAQKFDNGEFPGARFCECGRTRLFTPENAKTKHKKWKREHEKNSTDSSSRDDWF